MAMSVLRSMQGHVLTALLYLRDRTLVVLLTTWMLLTWVLPIALALLYYSCRDLWRGLVVRFSSVSSNGTEPNCEQQANRK